MYVKLSTYLCHYCQLVKENCAEIAELSEVGVEKIISTSCSGLLYNTSREQLCKLSGKQACGLE